MTVFDLYSKRQKRLHGEVPEVFTYDVPSGLRVQIVQIWDDAFGSTIRAGSQAPEIHAQLHKALAREYGVFSLGAPFETDFAALSNFFIQKATDSQALDIIELAFRFIVYFGSKSGYRFRSEPKVTPEEAVQELNKRFLEQSIGYAFESGELIRKDTELLHKEVVLPALVLLRNPQYKGANDEYLKAHEHYRHGRYKECLNECLKAFESTMKTICAGKKWKVDPNATAKDLIKTCFENGLMPPFLEAHYGALQSLLSSGIPTVRNKMGGHGQGAEVRKAPQHYASYLLNMTAATIVFLVNSAEN